MKKFIHGVVLLGLGVALVLALIQIELFWYYLIIASGSFALLWILFVLVFWLDRNKEKIPRAFHKPLMGLVFVGYVLDAFVNVFVASVIFWQAPDFKTARVKYLPTVTERLRDILRLRTDIEYRSKRYMLALWMCRYLIEPYDPNHCGLDDLQ